MNPGYRSCQPSDAGHINRFHGMIFNKWATEDKFQYRQDTPDSLTCHYLCSGTSPAGSIIRLVGMLAWMGGSCACHYSGGFYWERGGSLPSNAAGRFLKGGGEKAFSLDFTGCISIKGSWNGLISMLRSIFRLAHLPLPAQGNQPGKQHPSNFVRMHSGMEAPAPARSRDARWSSPCRNRNTGGTDATDNTEEGSGNKKIKRLEFILKPLEWILAQANTWLIRFVLYLTKQLYRLYQTHMSCILLLYTLERLYHFYQNSN